MKLKLESIDGNLKITMTIWLSTINLSIHVYLLSNMYNKIHSFFVIVNY